MLTLIHTRFRLIFWLTGLLLLLGSLFSFAYATPTANETWVDYALAYWVPIFIPTVLLCLLCAFAIFETIKLRRVWWGTLGYVLLTGVATLFSVVAFFMVTFAIFGFS